MTVSGVEMEDAGGGGPMDAVAAPPAPAITGLASAAAAPPAPAISGLASRLAALRREMRREGIAAYVIRSSDDHQSEYLPDHDKRRQFISGFAGSSGDAVITLKKAALWTDSRYYLQAQRQLGVSWALMKTGETETPTIENWIISELKAGDAVSTNPRTTSYSDWSSMNKSLSDAGILLAYLESDLVDRIWNESNGRPPYACDPLICLPMQYSGVSWEDKVKAIQKKMLELKVDGYVVTGLDEIAWLFNLRGSDILYTPVFRSYVIFGLDSESMSNFSMPILYLPDANTRLTEEVKEHLKASSGQHLLVKNYEEFWMDLITLGAYAEKILLPSPFSYAKGVSSAIVFKVPSEKIQFHPSPISEMKAIKNPVEAEGMKSAHVKDGVALVEFLYTIETGVRNGEQWDELKASRVATYLRTKQPQSHGPSFEPISAFGSNSALPHYAPTNETNKKIDGNHIFMFDSGGQYLDGTTDVTRTVFLGSADNVTDEMRDIYTRLLMGVADLASVVFPEGTTMQNLEILLRQHLYSKGYNYGHGSTHGIGHFLGVHEAFHYTYAENFFGSQEPGYYIPDKFGMRLENIVGVVKKELPNADKQYLGFETATLAPYENKLINPELMSRSQLEWVNSYHQRVMEVIGSRLLEQGKHAVHSWLEDKTLPIEAVC
ncbi:xaa-Pro aminopeptidase ApepP-like isoform X4 [Ischnura elegans]|nr:xaa-Pro aminopeptidase ApepP-like isoform X4 [Ischnura elegans]